MQETLASGVGHYVDHHLNLKSITTFRNLSRQFQLIQCDMFNQHKVDPERIGAK